MHSLAVQFERPQLETVIDATEPDNGVPKRFVQSAEDVYTNGDSEDGSEYEQTPSASSRARGEVIYRL